MRYFFSYVYRLIILLICIFNNWHHHNFIWFAIYIVYIILSIILLKYRTSISGFIRNLLDISLIYSVTYNAEILNLNNYVLLLIPILNIPNNSSKLKNLKLHFLFILIWAIAFIFIPNINYSEQIICLCVVVLFCLTYFVHQAYENFKEDLDRISNNVFNYSKPDSKPHKILERIMDYLKSSNIFGFNFTNIFIFKFSKKDISIVSSTVFFDNWKIINYHDMLTQLSNSRYTNISIELNDISYNAIIVKYNDISNDYGICFTLPNSVNCEYIINSLKIILLLRIMKQPFNTILQCVTLNDFVLQKKYAADLILSSNIGYINNAKTALHYVRNQLSPLKNHLEIIKDMNIQDTEKFNKQWNFIKNRVDDHMSRVLDIETHTDKMLMQKSSTYLDEDCVNMNYTDIITLLVRQWQTKIGSKSDNSSELERTFEKEFKDKVFNYKLPEKALVYLFDNWISNMEDYGGNIKKCHIEVGKNIKVTFTNNLQRNKMKYLRNLQVIFDRDISSAVNEENAFGIYTIKLICENFGIGCFFQTKASNKSVILEVVFYGE